MRGSKEEKKEKKKNTLTTQNKMKFWKLKKWTRCKYSLMTIIEPRAFMKAMILVRLVSILQMFEKKECDTTKIQHTLLNEIANLKEYLDSHTVQVERFNQKKNQCSKYETEAG